MPKVKLELDERALMHAAMSAFEDVVDKSGFDYSCPSCGSAMRVRAGLNSRPRCGYGIKVEKGRW